MEAKKEIQDLRDELRELKRITEERFKELQEEFDRQLEDLKYNYISDEFERLQDRKYDRGSF